MLYVEGWGGRVADGSVASSCLATNSEINIALK